MKKNLSFRKIDLFLEEEVGVMQNEKGMVRCPITTVRVIRFGRDYSLSPAVAGL